MTSTKRRLLRNYIICTPRLTMWNQYSIFSNFSLMMTFSLSFQTPVHFPLHLSPLPPPFMPSFIFKSSPAARTIFSSEPAINTIVVLLLVWVGGEEVKMTRNFLLLGALSDKADASFERNPGALEESSTRWICCLMGMLGFMSVKTSLTMARASSISRSPARLSALFRSSTT